VLFEILFFMHNEIILRFCIWGFNDIAHGEITNIMGIQPSKIYVKGERENSKSTALVKENGWLLEPTSDRGLSFEVQLENLLGLLESKKKLVKKFCEDYTCQISCGVFIYFDNGESTPSIRLSTEYNKLIRELDLEFDVDIYCLPN
jgi:hypothetical protein